MKAFKGFNKDMTCRGFQFKEGETYHAAGYGSRLAAGDNSVVAAFNSKVKAGLGSVIAIANREFDGDLWHITGFCAAVVDGVKIKPDTWYKVENGEFVEAE